MANSKVAGRYVKSLLSLAQDQNVLEEVHKDMQLIDKACESSRDLVLLLKSPVIRHEIKRSILMKLFEKKVHKLTLAIVDIVTRKNRESLLPEIANEFHNAYNDFKGVQKASITTTFALDDSLRKQVKKIIEELSKKNTIELDERIDKELIGGFVLNVGDKQIDASISSKLKLLEHSFSQNPYIKSY